MCSIQNGHTAKQSHCETVYDHSAFESPHKTEYGKWPESQRWSHKMYTRNGFTKYMQKQPWEAKNSFLKLKMKLKVKVNQAQNW